PVVIIVTGVPTDTPEAAISAETNPQLNPNEARDVAVQPTLPPETQPSPTIPAPAQPLTTPLPPTAVVPADQVLRIADRHLLNGQFESAAATYRTVLEQGEAVAATERAAAAYGLGEAALREGLFSDAVEALTVFIVRYPDDSRVPQARFLRGDAHLGLSLWAEAIADFQEYLRLRPGLIDSYALERIGDAQLALGQVDAALASYAAAADASRSTVPLALLRERIARVYLSVGQVTEAVAQFDGVLELARIPFYRAQIMVDAGEALLNAGDRENGLARMRQVIETYPEETAALAAMNTLLENGQPVGAWTQGRILFAAEDYARAIEAFNTFSTQTPLGQIPAELYLLLGQAYRAIGNTQAALTAFQTILDQHQTDPLFGTALLEQGRTFFLNDDIPGAIERYLRIADIYDYLPEAAEALWRVGFLYGTNDQPDQARPVFERLADTYPDSEWAISGLFLAASAAFNAGDLAGAERFYAELALKATGAEQADAYLQVGRLALERGDTVTAQQAFQQAIQAAPDTYFSVRAQDIVLDRGAFTPPTTYQFAFDEAAAIREAEDWLRTTFGIEAEGALWPLAPILEQDPRLVRGRELWAVAAYDEAQTEFGDLLDDYSDAPLASYQLAIFLRGLTAYRSSIIAAASVIRAAGVSTLDAPSFIARMRYPAYYLEVVQDAGSRWEVDPLLMFSLIRHESLFDTYATAAAGEIGLTQVIPGTGAYIAGELDWPDYQHTMLFRPYAGVEFGAFYLGEQLRRFSGNATAALAGYNAGPGRAQSWLQLSGGDPDLFMTAITINSTRQYVQRIYTSYGIYRVLYGTD
ncbi:MAG: tetratricopeptide repeat protein, partial [Chloroflexi bacterium]|nr:tetratricopeptide repeat protein [Chloroflexota bacterium]